MKKIALSIIPLSIFLLASCGGESNFVYTITFKYDNCRAFDETGEQELGESVQVAIKGSSSMDYKFILRGASGYKSPQKSYVSVKQTADNVDVEFNYDEETGTFLIPLNADLTVTAKSTDIKTLEECSWKEIDDISKSGKAESFFGPIYRKNPIRKTVMINNQPHIVHIIGYGEDYTELPLDGSDPDPNKAIGITFEFENQISDENGYSLATYWNDTTNENDDANHNYMDSTIRAVLNGNDYKGSSTADINWFRYYGPDEDTKSVGKNRFFAAEPQYKKCVLDMLPSDLVSVLKTPSKYINIWNGEKTPEPGFEEQTVSDKLFMLSLKEMGNIGEVLDEKDAVPYSFYNLGESSLIESRIRSQTRGDDEARTSQDGVYGKELSGKYQGAKYSDAGYDNPDEGKGAMSWLRSPNSGNNKKAFYLKSDGYFDSYLTYDSAMGVAPAFCI